MMNGLKSIRRERASLERDRVVLTSMMAETAVADAIMSMDEKFYESVEDDEIDAAIDKIPEADDDDEQINRILDSDKDMNLDEILGIDAEIPEGGSCCDEEECGKNC
jgi:hypothetical protein